MKDEKAALCVLEKHLKPEVIAYAVKEFANHVGTPKEQSWILDLCAYIEEKPEFDLGTPVTVESTGEVMAGILTMARWEALRREAGVMRRSLERVQQLMQDLSDGAQEAG